MFLKNPILGLSITEFLLLLLFLNSKEQCCMARINQKEVLKKGWKKEEEKPQ